MVRESHLHNGPVKTSSLPRSASQIIFVGTGSEEDAETLALRQD